MSGVRERLKAALTDAMKRRDGVAMGVLRSTLGAIDNAESVDETQAPKEDSASIAGAAVGLGATEVARLNLSDEEVTAIVQREVDEREAAAAEYDRLGQSDAATRLRAEAAVIAATMRP